MSQTRDRPRAVIRGGGDLGTGAALRLHRAGFRVAVLEVPQPTVIRRAVAFASAVYDGSIGVEGARARLARTDEELHSTWARGDIPIVVDPDAASLAWLKPDVLVDAIMAKRNLGTRIADASIVVALGPGFTAGVDCHAVVETHRGHNLGRVYYEGLAQADTGVPGTLGGQDALRVLHAPVEGTFRAFREIGERIAKGDVIGRVGESPIVSQVEGVLRGILHDGLTVPAGTKVADVDPRGMVEHCFSVSDKSWAVAGGVLEAVLHLRTKLIE